MNKQRKVLITITYNELGIITDTKAEEVTRTNLQPTCNQLATDICVGDTISRQAAIDALDTAIEHYDGIAEECRKKADIERNDYMDMRDDAYEARQLAQWLNELKYLREKIEQLTIKPEPQWIPCSERLPEQYGNYLVSYRTDDFESDIGTFDPDRINSDTGEWSACDANGFYWVASKGLEVIAWMPLPEPYKGGEQDG